MLKPTPLLLTIATLVIWQAVLLPGLAQKKFEPEIADPLSESWRWKAFPELEGKGVRCIEEDQEGNVWFGLNEGIIEYDGYDWNWHNEQNGLVGSPVEQVYAGSDGAIYATTPAGLFTKTDGDWAAIFTTEPDLELTYGQILERADGSLLLCTQHGLLSVCGGRVNQVYTSESKRALLSGSFPEAQWAILPDELTGGGDFYEVSSVLEHEDGSLWASFTLEGYSTILQFKPEEAESTGYGPIQVVRTGLSNPFGETCNMLRMQNGSIWVINRTTNIGIHRYDGNTWSYIELSERFGGDEYTTDIAQSSDGTIWVGALGKLFAYRKGDWEMYKAPDFKIPANRLLLKPSRGNNIWIGGQKSKVFRLDNSLSQWMTYRNLNFQCDNHRMEQWFLHRDGRAIRRRGNSWVAFDTAEGLIDAPVRIMATSKEQVWVAGSHEGVAATAYLENGRWHKQLHPELSWGIDYRAVFEARDGSIWFGGSVDHNREHGQVGGVLQLLNPTAPDLHWVHHRYQSNGLHQSNAYGIGQSLDGRIWIGGGSLMYFDSISWKMHEESHFRQFVNIVQSSDDLLLVGSRYYGVFIYDGDTWSRYDTDNGLVSNTIISLYAESPSSIWVATDNDISHFDGQNWVNHIFPEEMNMSFEGGAIMSSLDGSVWINNSSREWKRRAYGHSRNPSGTQDDFVVFRYRPDHRPPETEIELFASEISPDGNLVVSWSGEDFFGDTPDVRLLYAFRLNGGAWSPFSSETHHTFMDLGSGAYTIEVKARDMDFNEDVSPASASFTVKPPIWKQSWFISLMLFFLAIIGIFEYRIINKKQKLERLNQSLNDKNTELRLKNSQIQQQQEQILEQTHELEETNHHLERQNEEIEHQRNQLQDMVVKVEDLSRSKIKFFTNISHELRTPLSLIMGPLEQLEKEGESLTVQERKKMLYHIHRNAHRLLYLINQLLEMRRIEENTLDLNLKRGDLAAFLGDLTSLFDNLSRQKQVDLLFVNNCDQTTAAFDPDKVEKIMTNLIFNSFKHTDKAGEVRVKLDLDKMASPNGEDRDAFKITVSDTGSGMDEQTLSHIFERYYIGKIKGSGSGIGLSYIKDLVDLHQGKIEVKSRLGAGTTFTLYLPAELEAGNQVPEEVIKVKASAPVLLEDVEEMPDGPFEISAKAWATRQSADEERKALLIVEDNKELLEFLSTFFETKYLVYTAMNGLEGLQMARENSIDLIISDVMMPEMDGLEFSRRVKEDLATSHIPIILLTAKSMDEHMVEGFEVGVDAYLTKPFNLQVLESRVQNLLAQRTKLRKAFSNNFELAPVDLQLTSPDEKLLKKLVQIMEENISDAHFNVNKMCEMVHLSHVHFIRKVKQLTGKKPIDLLKSYRLRRAKELLKQNKLNISEVAYMVGYDLPNSFSRAFKKEFGCSPSQFVDSLESRKPHSTSDMF